MFTIVLSVEMLLMTCVGIFVQKSHMVTEDFASQLTKFVMNVALPCLIFHSMTSVYASWTQLINCISSFAASLAVCAVQFAVGEVLYILRGKTGSARVMRYGIIFTHFSFMGIPVMEALFGSEGLLYYSIFLIPVRVLYYAATKSLLIPQEVGKERFVNKVIQILKNPCLIAVLVGLVFYILFGLVWNDFTLTDYPGAFFRMLEGLVESVDWTITKLSGVCTPLGLILCGMTIGRYEIQKLLRPRYLILPLIRCLGMPALFFGMILLLGRFAVIDPIISTMVVVFAALPVASLTAAYTIQYDPDQKVQFEAAGAVFYSTLLSIVTVPVWYSIFS